MADTGGIVAVIDADERHHKPLKTLYESDPDSWTLPRAVLPEVDYLLSAHVGSRAEEAFLAELASGVFSVECGEEGDLVEARKLCQRHRALKLGLVDAVVIAVAQRLRADAIATLDLRHFGSVRIRGDPQLVPRDL